MTWALKRQLAILGGLAVVLFLIIFFTLVPYIKKIPTCTDQKQNGTEEGIDCGGSCPNACSFQVDEISILWARAFEIIPGRYNAVAYLENHNKDNAIERIKYRFRFSDENNLYIGKREGETFIPASGKFAVFEAGIGLGNSIPVYTSFEFTETPVWQQVSEDKLNQFKVSVSNIRFENQDTSPRLSATLENNSLFPIPNVGVVALLYDEKGNAVSASRTYIDRLKGESSVDVNFTWPKPILDTIVAKEIIPIFDIFSVNLK